VDWIVFGCLLVCVWVRIFISVFVCITVLYAFVLCWHIVQEKSDHEHFVNRVHVLQLGNVRQLVIMIKNVP